MATRGQKPNPASLAVVRSGKRGDTPTPGTSENNPEIPRRDEPLEPPKKLNQTQARLWKQYIDPAWWLNDGDVLLCYVFVTLMAEYLKAPAKMQTTRITELRRCMSDLHLTSSEQARLGVQPAEVDPAEKYFGARSKPD